MVATKRTRKEGPCEQDPTGFIGSLRCILRGSLGCVTGFVDAKAIDQTVRHKLPICFIIGYSLRKEDALEQAFA